MPDIINLAADNDSVKNDDIKHSVSADSSDVDYIKLGNTTYEVVSNYIGKVSLLEIVKNSIRRDIENGNY
jgi:hypothetical protein